MPLHLLPDFEAVGAGQTAIARIPRGLTYRAFYIGYRTTAGVAKTEAEIKADLTKIAFKKDGATIVELSATELYAINDYWARTKKDGTVYFPVGMPEARTPGGADELLWGTGEGVGQLTCEIDIDGAAVTPALKLHADRLPLRQPWGRFKQIRRYVDNIGATGLFNIQNYPPKGQRSLIAMHLNGGSLTDVRVIANSRDIYKANNAIEAEVHDEKDGRAWQSGYWHVNFAEDNRLVAVAPLSAIEDLQIDVTAGATGALTTLVETVEEPTAV